MVRISAKHQSAPKVSLVPIGAQPFRVAPISTNPKYAVDTDLLGDEVLPMARTNDRPEAAALVEVLNSRSRSIPTMALFWLSYSKNIQQNRTLSLRNYPGMPAYQLHLSNAANQLIQGGQHDTTTSINPKGSKNEH